MYRISRSARLIGRKLPRSESQQHGQLYSRSLSTSSSAAAQLSIASRLDVVRSGKSVESQPLLKGAPSVTPRFLRSFASGNLPKHTKVPLPALSPTMERGSIKSWEKKEGDKLNEGDLLALIETDKATMDFETPEEGYLAKILVQGGAKDIPLGQIVCVIVSNKEDVAAFKDFTPEQAGSSSDKPQKSGDSGEKSSSRDEKPSSRKQPSDSQKDQSDSGESKKASSASSDQGNYPAHQKINLPALSPTVEKSTIKSWGKKEGDVIKEGDMIAQVETDKATIDWNWENPEEVYVAKLFVPDGTPDVPVGQLVAIFVSDKKDVAAFKDMKADSSSKESEQKDDPTKVEKSKKSDDSDKESRKKDDRSEQREERDHKDESQPRNEKRDGERVFASPLARTLAKEKGIDLSEIRGSGPDGRIIADDVNNYKPSAKAAKSEEAVPRKAPKGAPAAAAEEGTYQDIPMTNIRQVIAKRLLQSKQTIPHYYLDVEIVLDEVMKLRQELNQMLEKEKVKLSVNDFIIKASALACRKVPQANSAWMDSFIRQYNMVDVSVAVSTDAGLITPIVFSADTKGLVDINKDVIRLADAARKGKLKPHEFQGGTFTVSNLGMFGIKNFCAVINPPQACILAIGSGEKQLIPDEKRKEGYRIATVMSVTLSCDHRVVDGAVGAVWLQHFKKFLEQPETMLL